MDEIQEIIGGERHYSEIVVYAMKNAFSCIMKTNCYELTPVEIGDKIHFTIPTGPEHQISVVCKGYFARSITMNTTLRVAEPCRFVIDLEAELTDTYTLNGIKLVDVKCFNPIPAIDHCHEIAQNLYIPVPRQGV